MLFDDAHFSDLPKSSHVTFDVWPDCTACLKEMEFRLTYEGPLPSNGGKDIKNEIRRHLHPQLRYLWEDHPGLKEHYKDASLRARQILSRANAGKCIYNFLPLIGSSFGIACSLDILFLRRDAPGSIIRHGGDLDNRLKTLFDALKAPETTDEMPISAPLADEDPYCTLLQDDKYIVDVKVTTDRWLAAKADIKKQHDVFLVIEVRTKLVEPTSTPMNLIFHL